MWLSVAVLIVPAFVAAQDIAITNARIIVGSGQVIDSGTIVVRGGKIVSVTAGAAPTQGLRTIDAKGMSAMPGFIDGHKHVNTFDAPQMKSLIEAGLINSNKGAVKVLANGEITQAITVKGLKVSAGAREKIVAAGGRVEE